MVFFIGDWFDSILEYDVLFEEILDGVENKVCILMGLPGSAYSRFSSKRVYDGLVISELIDRLLYELHERGVISLDSDTLKLIGVGYGGYLL